MPGGLKIFIPVIFLTIRQGWNYLLHLVEEKSSLEKPNWRSDVSPALSLRAGFSSHWEVQTHFTDGDVEA